MSRWTQTESTPEDCAGSTQEDSAAGVADVAGTAGVPAVAQEAAAAEPPPSWDEGLAAVPAKRAVKCSRRTV